MTHSILPAPKTIKKKMCILHIITGLGDGGAEATLYRLCIYDQSNRHIVISLTDRGKYGPLLEEKGIAVLILGMQRGHVSVSGLRPLWCALHQIKPDVVQTWMYHANLFGGLVSRLSGVNNVVWGLHHTSLDRAYTSRSTILVSQLCSILSKFIPSNIVCCAEACRQVHVDAGYDYQKLRVVNNGYDIGVFRPDPITRSRFRSELAIAEAEPIIGFVARYHPLKDHKNLLKAIVKLRSSGLKPTCLLVGTDVDYMNKELIAHIEAMDLGSQIRLLGPRTDIATVMNALDVHVMSSLGEAFPNVLAEAMACGTPCITTDVGDASMIVGTTGWIVPPRSSEQLARALFDALTELHTFSWRKRQEAARRRIETMFSVSSMIFGYHDAWGVDAV